MKVFNTVLSILLVIAVAYLFIREFSTKEEAAEKPRMTAEKLNQTLEGQDFSGIRMAYINTDSLVEKYEYHRELRDKLEKRAKELESDMARKSQAFQENIALLEERAASMTDAEIQEAQMDLQRVQQSLMAYRDEKGQELAAERSQLDSLIQVDLDTILTNIKTEFDLDFILSYDPNSILLSANENYDITDVVLERLNRHYRKQQATKEE